MDTELLKFLMDILKVMKIEKYQFNASFLQAKESSDDLFLSFDLPSLIRMLKFSNAWEMGELSSAVLLKSPDKQIVLAAMHEGTVITSKKTDRMITLKIIEGSLMLEAGKEILSMDEGNYSTVTENTRFQLTSRDKTVLLVTVEAHAIAPGHNQLNQNN
jgi:hypothetical protein